MSVFRDAVHPNHVDSIEHWNRFLCFSDISFNGNSIKLVIDESQYSKEPIETNEIANKVLTKVSNEFQLIREFCFCENPYLTPLVRIELLNQNVFEVEPSYSANIEEDGNEQVEGVIIANDEVQSDEVTEDHRETALSAPYSFDIIASDTANKIDSFIHEHTLYKDSHFIISSSVCARDWIDTASIIEDRKLKAAICDDFVRHLRVRWDVDSLKKVVIVGIGVRGTAIASTMALEMRMPFSYIIPENSLEHNSMQDKKFLTDEYISDGYEEFILVTDVIVSSDTIKNAIIDNGLNDRVPAVYSVLCRPIINFGEFKDKLADKANSLSNSKIYALSENFSIWLFNKADCTVYALSKRNGVEFQCLDCNKISS